MAVPDPRASQPVALVWGDDEFAVKQRGRKLFSDWCGEGGGWDPEIIEASASNGAEALTALARLTEALQTFSLFGGGKAIWFQNCTFLGDDRTSGSQAVTERLAELSQQLKSFAWQGVRLLITAGKVDKRKTLYKTLEKIGTVEVFAGWSVEDKDWEARAEGTVRGEMTARKLRMADDAVANLIQCVGPHPRHLANEIEKLSIYIGERDEITREDVDSIVVRNRQSRAFALADAYGARDLKRLLHTLDEELWEMKRNTQKSEIGMLYGIISKTRVMLFLKEMTRQGWISGELDYTRFKSRLEKVPTDALPGDRRFNPLGMHPYMLYQALDHSKKYSMTELVEAMDALLVCNHRLISSAADPALIVQQALIKIVSRAAGVRVT